MNFVSVYVEDLLPGDVTVGGGIVKQVRKDSNGNYEIHFTNRPTSTVHPRTRIACI